MFGDTPDDYCAVECKILKVSTKALLIRDENDMQVWVPRSVVQESDAITPDSVDETMRLYVRRWFADKEGLV